MGESLFFSGNRVAIPDRMKLGRIAPIERGARRADPARLSTDCSVAAASHAGSFDIQDVSHLIRSMEYHVMDPTPNKPTESCCDFEFSRRDFVRTVGSAALASGLVLPGSLARAADAKAPAETLVKQLHGTLTDSQKEVICMPYDHALRSRISANWSITRPKISSDFYTVEQRELIKQIFRGVSSEDGFERFLKQTEFDNGGWDEYHVAIFGEPGSPQFEWTMTGRHLTIRADGNFDDGVAFGGPTVYGHGEEDPDDNLFHYQTKAANEIFAALDAPQRKKALLQTPPRETDVLLQGPNGTFRGLSASEFTSDQLELLESVIKTVLAPYREPAVAEAMSILKQGGGLQKLHMAFYQQGDLKNDKVWDIWRVEGPTFVAHFRGAPHVHAYLNIGLKS
jgi:hypothetical protein